eukprot:COSAG01_NODE_8145_length_2904_cov_12.910160_1_plen_593_part_00
MEKLCEELQQSLAVQRTELCDARDRVAAAEERAVRAMAEHSHAERRLKSALEENQTVEDRWRLCNQECDKLRARVHVLQSRLGGPPHSHATVYPKDGALPRLRRQLLTCEHRCQVAEHRSKVSELKLQRRIVVERSMRKEIATLKALQTARVLLADTANGVDGSNLDNGQPYNTHHEAAGTSLLTLQADLYELQLRAEAAEDRLAAERRLVEDCQAELQSVRLECAGLSEREADAEDASQLQEPDHIVLHAALLGELTTLIDSMVEIANRAITLPPRDSANLWGIISSNLVQVQEMLRQVDDAVAAQHISTRGASNRNSQSKGSLQWLFDAQSADPDPEPILSKLQLESSLLTLGDQHAQDERLAMRAEGMRLATSVTDATSGAVGQTDGGLVTRLQLSSLDPLSALGGQPAQDERLTMRAEGMRLAATRMEVPALGNAFAAEAKQQLEAAIEKASTGLHASSMPEAGNTVLSREDQRAQDERLTMRAEGMRLAATRMEVPALGNAFAAEAKQQLEAAIEKASTGLHASSMPEAGNTVLSREDQRAQDERLTMRAAGMRLAATRMEVPALGNAFAAEAKQQLEAAIEKASTG